MATSNAAAPVAKKTAKAVSEAAATNGNVIAARLPGNLLLTVTGAAVGSALATVAVVKVTAWNERRKNNKKSDSE